MCGDLSTGSGHGNKHYTVSLRLPLVLRFHLETWEKHLSEKDEGLGTEEV